MNICLPFLETILPRTMAITLTFIQAYRMSSNPQPSDLGIPLFHLEFTDVMESAIF